LASERKGVMAKLWEEMSSEERKQAEADWRRSHPSTAEMAMARCFASGTPEGLPLDYVDGSGRVVRAALPAHQRDRIEAEISAAMVGVVEDGRKPNPITGGPSLPTVQPMGAVPVRSGPGTGWREGAPLHSSANNTTNAYIDALAHQAFPHSPKHPDYKGRGPKPKE
jgi:hypothetical protein